MLRHLAIHSDPFLNWLQPSAWMLVFLWLETKQNKFDLLLYMLLQNTCTRTDEVVQREAQKRQRKEGLWLPKCLHASEVFSAFPEGGEPTMRPWESYPSICAWHKEKHTKSKKDCCFHLVPFFRLWISRTFKNMRVLTWNLGFILAAI